MRLMGGIQKISRTTVVVNTFLPKIITTYHCKIKYFMSQVKIKKREDYFNLLLLIQNSKKVIIFLQVCNFTDY